MKFAWSFNGLSRNFQGSPRSFTSPDGSCSVLRGWNGSKQSFSGLWGKSFFDGLSAAFQLSLKVLLVFRDLSTVFPLRVLPGSWSVFLRSFNGLSMVFQRSWLIFQRFQGVLQMIFQWSLSSRIGLSVNFQLSSGSYKDLAGKVVFDLSMVVRSHYTETANFIDLGECWKTLQMFSLSAVFKGYLSCGMGPTCIF